MRKTFFWQGVFCGMILAVIFAALGAEFYALRAEAAPNKLNLNQQALQPVTNSAVFATHNQIQQATALRCSSQNGTNAYTCAPCPPNGACVSGIGPMPVVNQMAYGMELQLIADVPCPLPGVNVCTLNVDTLGAFSIFTNGNGVSTAPATFGPGFHRVAADQIGTQWVWRLEY